MFPVVPKRFYGQMGEDKFVFETFFLHKRNGVFLEMGAYDGVTYSNTKFFEDFLGWRGILIEPVPTYAAIARDNRPRSVVYNCAVTQSQAPVEIYVNHAVSSVKEHTTDEYYKGWHNGKHIQTIQVPSRRLDDILHERGVTHIDFWSLDVEGSEYDVLQTMDWSIPVRVICIEMCGGESAAMNEQCRDLLRSQGYRLYKPFAHNEIWVR